MAESGKWRFFNRELSWLDFNRRVLAQCTGSAPLFERLRFLAITASNLDEFFMIRVPSVLKAKRKHPDRADISGLLPHEQLNDISRSVSELYGEMAGAYEVLAAQCAALNIRPDCPWEELDEAARNYYDDYFDRQIAPALEPVMLSRREGCPFLAGRALWLGVVLKWRSGDIRFGAVQLPAAQRVIPLPEGPGVMMTAEQLVRRHVHRLFPDCEVLSCSCFRLTRNADIELDEDEPGALADSVRRMLPLRSKGQVVRLELEKGMDKRLAGLLSRMTDVPEQLIFRSAAPLDLTFLEKNIYPMSIGDAHRYAPFTPVVPECLLGGESIFDVMRRRDILLQHPFDSFEPVVELLRQAAEDEQVVAVRITLYRVSRESPIIDALALAARMGKQVTAFIEARARFDEERNLTCGKKLEQAGVNVIYGLPGLKTHSKIALVVRREPDGMRKYTHLGTGNYNDVTARAYTDYSLLTSDMAIGGDALEFFRCLTGSLEHPDTEKLVVSPFELRSRFKAEIKKERAKGKDGRILARMNSLTDKGMIKELYKASCDGVKIRLLVRGACCLIPGVEGMSENIEVRSIIGRFLEHSRAYIFGSGEKRRVYLSSADWMTRNLDYRVELMFPVTGEDEADRVAYELETCMTDAPGTYRLRSGGAYRDTGGKGGISTQKKLLNARRKSAQK